MITTTLVELLFWALVQGVIVGVIIKKVYKRVELAGPLLLFKSKKGLRWIERQSKRFKRFWPVYGSFGIILAFGFAGAMYVFRKKVLWKRIVLSSLASLFLVAPYISSIILFGAKEVIHLDSTLFLMLLNFAFGFSISTFYLLLSQAVTIVHNYIVQAPVVAMVGPALPGINVQGSPIQGIPWYGWFAFPILIVVHEFSHGILARFHKFRVKATGLVMLGLLPLGAFVEPDEKQLSRGAVQKRLHVFSVGSTANYLTSVVVTLLLFSALYGMNATGIYEEYEKYLDHPMVTVVSPDSDAVGKLEPGMKILSVNGNETKTVLDINKATESVGPGNIAVIETDKGTFNITLNKDAKIGIRLEQTYKPLPLHLSVIQGIISFLGLVAFFNLVVGIMNLLPAYPLDGGYMLQGLLENKVKKKTARKFVKFLSIFILALFIVNILPLIFR
ncbi:MAG: site-2 protease family protein [Candidatus Diapherotrites archaeon]|nr:site-2 protease family protein [Candidatus Diapherotrites archaeon]